MRKKALWVLALVLILGFVGAVGRVTSRPIGWQTSNLKAYRREASEYRRYLAARRRTERPAEPRAQRAAGGRIRRLPEWAP